MFCNDDALVTILRRVGELRHLRYVYLAAHGNDTSLVDNGDQPISRTRLRNALNGWQQGCIDGLYVGACGFGHHGNAAFLLGDTPLKWVAGYESPDVNWLQSSALDLLFWNTFLTEAPATPPVRRIRTTATELARQAPGLVHDLGFQIWTRGRTGLRRLLDPAEALAVLADEMA